MYESKASDFSGTVDCRGIFPRFISSMYKITKCVTLGNTDDQ